MSAVAPRPREAPAHPTPLPMYPLARLYPRWYEYLALGKRARVRR